MKKQMMKQMMKKVTKQVMKQMKYWVILIITYDDINTRMDELKAERDREIENIMNEHKNNNDKLKFVNNIKKVK